MTLNEALDIIKFRYDKPTAHTKNPKVIILDNDYPGRVGEKNYGKTHDILGVKINDFSGRSRKELQDRIEKVYSQDIDKLDKYLQLSLEVKEAIPYIRRYKKKNIKHARRKGKWFYHEIKEV